MEEIFNNINTIIMMYSPIILSYVAQLVDWGIMIKSIKKVDVQTPIKKYADEVSRKFYDVMTSLEETKKDNLTLKQTILRLQNDNKALIKNNSEFKKELSESIENQNKIIMELINKNLELEKKVYKKEA